MWFKWRVQDLSNTLYIILNFFKVNYQTKQIQVRAIYVPKHKIKFRFSKNWVCCPLENIFSPTNRVKRKISLLKVQPKLFIKGQKSLP